MKKIIYFLISIVFILSIAVVSFLGLRLVTFDQRVYIESIELDCEKYEIKQDALGNNYIVIVFDEDNMSENVVWINYHLYPENPTVSKLDIICEDSQFGEVTQIGEAFQVQFGVKNGVPDPNVIQKIKDYESGCITVIVSSMDGSQITSSIDVYTYYQTY